MDLSGVSHVLPSSVHHLLGSNSRVYGMQRPADAWIVPAGFCDAGGPFAGPARLIGSLRVIHVVPGGRVPPMQFIVYFDGAISALQLCYGHLLRQGLRAKEVRALHHIPNAALVLPAPPFANAWQKLLGRRLSGVKSMQAIGNVGIVCARSAHRNDKERVLLLQPCDNRMWGST